MATAARGDRLVWARARRGDRQRRLVEEIVDFLELEQWRRLPVGLLPYGVQKRVELGRALAMEPRLLLLDEPVAGMNLEETEDMARYILDIRDELDIPMILVEHDMGLVMDLADRVLVLDFGAQIATGVPEPRSSGPRGHPRLYLGQEVTRSPMDQPWQHAGRRRRPDRALAHRRDEPTGSRCARRTWHLAGGHLGASTGTTVRWPGTRCSRSASSPVTGSRSTRRTGPSGCSPTWPPWRSGRDGRASTRPTRPPRSRYLSRHSGAKMLVAEDQEQVDKALAVARRVPRRPARRLPRAARHPAPLRRPQLLSLGRLPGAGRERTGAAPGRGRASVAAASGPTTSRP